MANLITPTTHMNGTSKADLVGQLEAASDALRSAWDALQAAGPNGRDYYPQGPDAMARAVREHRARLEHIRIVMDEIGIIWEAVG